MYRGFRGEYDLRYGDKSNENPGRD